MCGHDHDVCPRDDETAGWSFGIRIACLLQSRFWLMCSGSGWQRQWQKCLCSVWGEKASRLETSVSYQIALHIHWKLYEPLRKLTSRSPFPLYIFLWIDWSRHFFAVQLEWRTLASTYWRHNLYNNSTKQTHAMPWFFVCPFPSKMYPCMSCW